MRRVTTCCTYAVTSRKKCHVSGCQTARLILREKRFETPAKEHTYINCKMTLSLYQVPYFKLTFRSETRVATARVSERKKTKVPRLVSRKAKKYHDLWRQPESSYSPKCRRNASRSAFVSAFSFFRSVYFFWLPFLLSQGAL